MASSSEESQEVVHQTLTGVTGVLGDPNFYKLVLSSLFVGVLIYGVGRAGFALYD
jgi:hypothetical protein